MLTSVSEAPGHAPLQSSKPTAFLERYRRLFNRRGNDWWSIVFAYPVARLLVAFLEPIRWVTPSLLTLAGFGCKLGAAVCLWTGSGLGSLALVPSLLQASQLFDAMDGTLARARRQFSLSGAFLDKATDAVGFAAVAIALGRRAAISAGDPLWASLGGAAAAAFLAIGYLHWVVRAVHEPGGAESLAGGAPALPWTEIGREWLRGWKRIVRFGEADSYLWISLFALAGSWRACVVYLVAVHVIGLVYVVIHSRRRLAPDHQE